MNRPMHDPGMTIGTEFRSAGARLISTDGRDLPLRTVEVSARAAGGLARTELRQDYHNPHEEPLELTYKFPLPADGAVAGYELRIGDRVIRGEIDRRLAARKRYERALIEGHSAALLDQERANLFTQHLGNVPPGEAVTVALTIDQPLAWLADGNWEWRFPTVAAPRYLGAEGHVPDASAVTLDVNRGPTGIEVTFDLVIGDEITQGEATSPSHPIRKDGTRVLLDGEGAALDRDIVVRWTVAHPRAGLSLRTARPAEAAAHSGSAYGLLTVVPPLAPEATVARDLIVMLDVSGSMMGKPIDRAKQLAIRLIGSLSETDRLEMVAFAHRPQRWQPRPVEASLEARREAVRWVEGLTAGGGTEMVSAIKEALNPVRPEAQRQVVLVTDGLIGFETEAIKAIRDRLPRGSRLHSIGVGSATNRAFLHGAARAGRGIEVIAGLDDDLHESAHRIVAATQGPTVIDLEVSGSAVEQCAPRKPTDVMVGAPVLQGVRLRPEGGELKVRGRTPNGDWEQRIEVPPTPYDEGGPAVIALYGKEAVEDLELDAACGARRDAIDRQIETIGLEFGLATRLTSWVAVSEEPTVDPREPVRVERVPQELPHGMSAEGLGLRRTSAVQDAFTGGFLTDRLEGAMVDAESPGLDMMRLTSVDLSRASRTVELSRPGENVPIVLRSIDALIAWIGALIERLELEGADTDDRLKQVYAALLELRRIIAEPATGDDDLKTAINGVRHPLCSLDPADRLVPLIGALLDRIDRDRLTAFEGPRCVKLRGRVSFSRSRPAAIVGFLTPQPLDWRPPEFAALRTGESVELAMLGTRKTTRAGRVGKSRLVRLELEIEREAMAQVQEISLYCDESILVIEIDDRA